MSENDETRSPRPIRDPRDAREQAAEFLGFTASKLIPLPGGGDPVEIPNPGLFDDEQQERWDELQMFLKGCVQAPDVVVPDSVITLKDGTTTTIPGRTVPGGTLQPLQRETDDGETELVKPGYAVRQAIAVLGEEEYKRFKAGGGRANDIGVLLRQMQVEFEERVKRDPKSGVGAVDVASAPDGD